MSLRKRCSSRRDLDRRAARAAANLRAVGRSTARTSCRWRRVTQYSMMLVSSSSRVKLRSTSPSLSLQVRNFSTIQAASPTGESVRPYASVCGLVPWMRRIAGLFAQPVVELGAIRLPSRVVAGGGGTGSRASGSRLRWMPSDVLGVIEPERGRDERAPVAALRPEAVVAQHVDHQLGEDVGDGSRWLKRR